MYIQKSYLSFATTLIQMKFTYYSINEKSLSDENPERLFGFVARSGFEPETSGL